MSSVRLVTFDVTNTIIRVLGSVGQNYTKVAAMYGKSVDPSRLDACFKQAYKHQMEQYPNFGVNSSLTPTTWWDRVVKDTFRKAGTDEQQLDAISKHLYGHFATRQGWEVLPQAERTLISLKRKGIKLGIVSNFDDRLEKILTELSLMHYFDFVLSSAVVKMQKPDPGIFKMALKLADVKSEEALHVGDNILTDYEGSRAVSMFGVLLWKKDKSIPENVDANYVIYQLQSLLQFIK